MSLDIRVNGISLNLFPGEEKNFYITKQLHDLRDLKTRNASFVKEITVPNVGINASLLRQYIPQFASQNQSEITYTPVDILMDDVPVITDALLFSSKYSRNEKEITITILVEDQSFFEQLTDSPISELFTETIQWNLANLLANVNNLSSSDFWVYPDLIWNDNDSYQTYKNLSGGGNESLWIQDSELSGFLVYAKSIWDRIMNNVDGLTVDDSWQNTLFNNLGLAVPTPQFLAAYSEGAGFISSVTDTDSILPSETAVKVPFNTVVADPESLWDNANDKFVIPAGKGGLGKVTVEFTVDIAPQQQTNNQNNFIRLRKNGIVIQQWVFIAERVNSVTVSISYSETVNLLAGDEIQLTATTDDINNATPFKFIFDTGEIFSILFGQPQADVIVSEVMPEITQKDFVKSIMQLFHLIPQTKSKQVTFTFWEDIPGRTPNLLSGKVAIDKKINTANLINSYGKNNHFKYADNEAVLRTDMNQKVPSKIATLNNDVTLIQLVYSATDDSLVPSFDPSTVNGRGCIPAYKYKYTLVIGNNISLTNGSATFTTPTAHNLEPGDVISVTDVATDVRIRVASISSDTSGELTAVWFGTTSVLVWSLFRYEALDIGLHLVNTVANADRIYITNSEQLPVSSPNNRKAYFNDEMLWFSLIQNYYQIFVDSIEKPFVVQLWVYLRVQEFIILSPLTPIWIEEFADYFYLNKIEQYKQNKLTRIELIRIKN